MALSTSLRGARTFRTEFAAGKFAPLVGVSRSGVVESIHMGAVAVVTGAGERVAQVGEADVPVFWRSAAKLHQALALVHAGGVKRWQWSDAQLAIMCGSHNGEPAQVRCVQDILQRIGLAEDALRCGVQAPHSTWAAAELARKSQKPSAVHHMCSGNHAGLLALTRLLGGDVAAYENQQAPAEVSALEIAARFAELAPTEIFLGIDGCGIPAYRTELWRLALAFARLIAVPREWEMRIHASAQTVVNAVTRHPDMISGAGEIDAECIRAFGGAAICKLGAEGVCAAAWAPSERFPAGVGVALKVADGLGSRAIPVVLAATIAQLELGTEEQRATLERHVDRSVSTHTGDPVGELLALFELAMETDQS